MPGRPCRADFFKILGMRGYTRRNHSCQISRGPTTCLCTGALSTLATPLKLSVLFHISQNKTVTALLVVIKKREIYITFPYILIRSTLNNSFRRLVTFVLAFIRFGVIFLVLISISLVDRKGENCVIANQRSVGDSYAYF